MRRRKREPVTCFALDVAALYEAVDAERRRSRMTLEQVAAELDVSYSTMACWRCGGGGIQADAALRLALWMDIDLRDFARPPDRLPATQGRALRHRGLEAPAHDRLPVDALFFQKLNQSAARRKRIARGTAPIHWCVTAAQHDIWRQGGYGSSTVLFRDPPKTNPRDE